MNYLFHTVESPLIQSCSLTPITPAVVPLTTCDSFAVTKLYRLEPAVLPFYGLRWLTMNPL